MKETKLILTPRGFKSYELVSDFVQHTSYGEIRVPMGTVTDLASIPRILWMILPPFGRYSQAAVVHDYLYKSGLFTRKEADKIFKELMLRYGTYKWKANVMYRSVRIFGRGAWKWGV